MTLAALATAPYGVAPYGGAPVHDAPTVALTAPTGTIATGGPTVLVSWTYAQAQGVAQKTYRVIITNAAQSTTYYDSGLLTGTAASLSVNLVANSVPTDTTGSALRVSIYVESADGSPYNATAAGLFDVQWGVATCVITSPTSNQVIFTSSLTTTWTFASTRGKTQQSYRVRLLNQAGVVLYDSGWVASTATSLAIPYVLADLFRYTLGVQLKNSEGVPS